MPSKQIKSYPLNQSPFYKLQSKKRLARILGTSLEFLNRLVHAENLYRCEIIQANGKPRQIEKPCLPLKQLQRRISDLLHRIEKPNYLFCPAQGKSYIGNAQMHITATVVRSLDIKSYYTSTVSRRIYWFFHKRMHCSSDVAALLTVIATFEDRLPTGSPASPMLSYYAHIDMWEEIYALVIQAGCTLTVYMDDLTISGKNVPGVLMWEIKKQIRRCGLRYHKERYYHHKTSEVTGIIISNGELKLPHRKHENIHTLRSQLFTQTDPKAKRKIRQRIQGCLSEFQQLEDANSLSASQEYNLRS